MLEMDKSKLLKPYIKFITQKIIEEEKNGEKDGKAFYKFMNDWTMLYMLKQWKTWVTDLK